MATIYKNAQGQDVYDNAGKTYDAHTGQVVNTALPPVNAPAPTGTPAATTPTAPPLPTSSSPLVTFANSINAAVNLAKQHRNAQSLDIMKPFQGTVAASDFNSILGNLNNASDNTTSDLIKNATKADTPSFKTEQIGDTLYQYQVDPNGQVIGTPKPLITNKSSSTAADTAVHSGSLTYTREDYSGDSKALEKSRGSDGYVNSGTYKQLYDAWVKQGGLLDDFLKAFPSAQYVNPTDNSVPVFLRPKTTGVVANPFS